MGLASDGIRACLNFAGDDGISCVPNATECRPVQDGFTSWDTLMSEISPMLQQRDKLFSVNTVNGPRVHQFRWADLFITEQSAHDYGTSCVNSWLGLRKPGVMWTTSTSVTDCPHGEDCSDRFFQRLLHLGLFPMPPMPDADHSLQNGSAAVHAQFLRYGPLFRMLKGREWVLRPHAVSVKMATPEARSQLGVMGNVATQMLRPHAVSVKMATPEARSQLGVMGNVATLSPCAASDAHQLWQNLTASPYCTHGQPCGELSSKGKPGLCLEVQSGCHSAKHFS
eukprot:COSAG04_NODE_1134_length_8122_cov_4.650256_4_plen_282_part_00